jgi:putative acetyltransferase
MTSSTFKLRPYRPADEDGAIELWRDTWAAAYPQIDFRTRVDWWRERWRNELVPNAEIVVADDAGRLVGFVTVELASGYLDQIVVATPRQGSGVAERLLAAARHLSPQGLHLDVNQDNARAIRFYQKHGFVTTGEGVNALSGALTYQMRWQPVTSHAAPRRE